MHYPTNTYLPPLPFPTAYERLPFAVLLPPSLQPSFRCPYGRQEYSAYAIAEEVDGKQHTAESQIVNLLSPGENCNRPLLDVVTYNDNLGVSRARSHSIELSLTRVRPCFGWRQFISATMHCDIPRIGGQAFLQIDMPRPKPDITIVSILVSLVQTVRVTSSSGMSVARTGERQLARCCNAAAAGSADPLTGKIAYAPRWKQGQPVSLAQHVWLPTHAVSQFSPFIRKEL